MAVILGLIVTFCTEFASNAAIASIFLPVVARLVRLTQKFCVSILTFVVELRL